MIEQTTALFTDNKFHNIGVGINGVQNDVPALAGEFLKAKATLAEVDVKVLGDKRTSELGRFAISRNFEGLGAFKTSTLRNVAVTSPYMHDGSIKTLREVVDPLQQRRRDQGRRPRQRLPERRHPAAGADRSRDRRSRRIPRGAHEPGVRVAAERRTHGGEVMNPFAPVRPEPS